MSKDNEKDKYNFLPRESKGLHPTFQVDDKAFTLEAYDKNKNREIQGRNREG